jgi:hypothetical protein
MSSDKEYSIDYSFIYRKVVIVLKLIAIILSVVSIVLLYGLNIELKIIYDSQPVEIHKM